MRIRPKEVKKPIYWIHILVIAVIVLGILQLWQGDMFSIRNIIFLAVLIGVADIISHSILGID